MCDCNAPSLRTDRSEYGEALRKKIAEEHEAKKLLKVITTIAEMHCYRKKLGSPCHKALDKSEWCAVCVARNFINSISELPVY